MDKQQRDDAYRLLEAVKQDPSLSEVQLPMNPPIPPQVKRSSPMSIDSTLSKANKAPFSVVGAVCAAVGVIFIFHSSIQEDAFKYGYGSITTGAQLIALGTILQHTKKLSQK